MMGETPVADAPENARQRQQSVELVHAVLRGLQLAAGAPGLSTTERRYLTRMAADLGTFAGGLVAPVKSDVSRDSPPGT
jgi:dihydrodipicolinate synthase/N-acetylneuraminate lyase